MEQKDYIELAEEQNFKIIETTDKSDGYPHALRHGVIGFESFSEAKDFAEQVGGEVYRFEKENGWILYYREGWTDEPIDTTPFYEDDFLIFSPYESLTSSLRNYMEMDNDFTAISDYVHALDEVYKAQEYAEEDEYVILNRLSYDVMRVKKEVMSIAYDNKQVEIGVLI